MAGIPASPATCPECGHVVDAWPLDAWCAQCGHSRPCPPHTEWPRWLKRWITERILTKQFAPHGGLDDDHAWRHMLAMELRGTGHTLPTGRVVHFGFAASPDDVFTQAVALAARAEANRVAARTAAAAPQNPVRAPEPPEGP